jgi:FkbM family methyltransferase
VCDWTSSTEKVADSMSWRTNRQIVALRSYGRKLGLNKLVARVISSQDYEHKFQDEMLSEIQEGDCVWDVGANVGLYTKTFSELVGPRGKVFAFEPSPVNFGKLSASVGSLRNVSLIPLGLGCENSTLGFIQGEDPLGATSKVVEGVQAAINVEIAIGDDLLKNGIVELPQVVKIDTEGFELDVVRGMRNIMSSRTLRTFCIEIHFGLLEERGQANAPAEIEKLLKSAGFVISWPDSSHIIANRPPP